MRATYVSYDLGVSTMPSTPPSNAGSTAASVGALAGGPDLVEPDDAPWVPRNAEWPEAGVRQWDTGVGAPGVVGTRRWVPALGAPAPEIVEVPSADDSYENDVEFDTVSFKSLGGVVQLLLRVAICVSIFSCLGRSDFTLPVLLYNYYEWSVAGEWSAGKIYSIRNRAVKDIYKRTSGLLVASDSTVRGVKTATQILMLATVVDAVWAVLGTAAWTCFFSDRTDCLTHEGLRQTYPIHVLALSATVLNLLVKASVVACSIGWLRIQKQARAHMQAATV